MVIVGQSVAFDKIILFDATRYISISRDGRLYINPSDTNSLPQKEGYKQIYRAPNQGSFKSSPLFWDMIDSFILQINLYTDGTQMTFAHLRQYNISKLITYDDQILRNYVSNETLKDNYVLPIESKEMRIHFREDTLKGPVYFDFCATKDSFLLYVYVHDSRSMEVWSFIPYLTVIKKYNPPKSPARPVVPKWALLRTFPITLDGPFQTVHTQQCTYMITGTGEIFKIQPKGIRQVGFLPEKSSQGTLLIDKMKDEVYFIKELDIQESLEKKVQNISKTTDKMRILIEK